MAMRRHAAYSGAYTLVEMLLVVAVLAVVAVVAMPASQPVTESRADTAAGEVVNALRLAREAALHSGAQRLFSCDAAANSVAVVALDTSGPSTMIATIQPDPAINQVPYQMALNAAPAGNTMTIVRCTFTFADNSSAVTVGFDAGGNPVRALGSGPARTSALRAGQVVLGSGNVVRTIDLHATGRITVS